MVKKVPLLISISVNMIICRNMESHQGLDVLVFFGDAFDVAGVSPQGQTDSVQGASAEDKAWKRANQCSNDPCGTFGRSRKTNGKCSSSRSTLNHIIFGCQSSTQYLLRQRGMEQLQCHQLEFFSTQHFRSSPHHRSHGVLQGTVFRPI